MKSASVSAAWASSKPPLLRFLDRCHQDFLSETGGAVADYIPELGKADPDHFGIGLATLDGHVYEVGDTKIPFTIQSMSKPFVFALALDTLGAARVESAIDQMVQAGTAEAEVYVADNDKIVFAPPQKPEPAASPNSFEDGPSNG